MRPLRVALIGSLAVHAAAIGWALRGDVGPAPRPRWEPRRVELAEPPPTEITLLDERSAASERTAASAAPVASAASAASARAHAHAAMLGAEREPEHEHGHDHAHAPAPAAPNAPDLLRMRHPALDGVGHVLSGDELDRVLDTPIVPLPKKDTDDEQIASDLAIAEGHLHDPRWVANASPDQLRLERIRGAQLHDAWAARELGPDGAGLKSEHAAFVARVEPDGTTHVTDKPNWTWEAWPFRAHFDITDWAMRSHGIDPYASAKLRLLDRTRDERAVIGARYRTAQLARTPMLVQQNIGALRARAKSPAELKQGLFALWDDAAETGPPELVAAGDAARTYIVGAIRSYLPAGSADAFTAAELAGLNARRTSHRPFVPYE